MSGGRGRTDAVENGSLKRGSAGTLFGANALIGNGIYDKNGAVVGNVKELMVNAQSGSVCYAVISSGGFIGLGEKIFIVPWRTFSFDALNKCLVLKVDVDRLREAANFDPDKWPDMADNPWAKHIHAHLLRS